MLLATSVILCISSFHEQPSSGDEQPREGSENSIYPLSYNTPSHPVDTEYRGQEDPGPIKGQTRGQRSAEANPYTLFGSVRFNSMEKRNGFLWAVGNNVIMQLKTGAGDMRMFGIRDGVPGNVTGMRSNCNAVYFRGDENFLRYDIMDDGLRNIELPANIFPGDILDFFPLLWENVDTGEASEGLVLVTESRIVVLDTTSPKDVRSLYRENIPAGLGDHRWIGGFTDNILIGFTEGMLEADHEGISEIVGGIGSEYGVVYDRVNDGEITTQNLALAVDGNIIGYTYTPGTGEKTPEINENGTLWDSGLQEEIISLDVAGSDVIIAIRDRLRTKIGSKESSLDVPDVTDALAMNGKIYVLMNGTLSTVSGNDIEEMNVNLNAPVPDIINMDAGENLLVASSAGALSVLPGATGPSGWINTDAILGTHLKAPVHCLDENGNIWLAQSGAMFKGTLTGAELSWTFYLVPNMISPASLTSLGDLLLLSNESAVMTFNGTTSEDDLLLVSNNTTGGFIKCVGDEFENCFWVLAEKGVMKIFRNANGSLDNSFHDMRYLPGDEVIDLGTSNNVVWVLMEEAVARFYKPTGEWWNYTFGDDMIAAELETVYSRGHEIYLGGKELFYMDEWSGIGGFIPVSFGQEKLDRIIAMDGRDFRKDDTGEIFLLDPGGIRIYDSARSNWQSLTTSNGLASNDIRQVAKDGETGNIWVAAYGGVTRYEPNSSTFQVITADDGLSNNFVYTVHIDEHGVWFGTDGGGVCLITRDEQYEALTMEDGLAADDVLKIKSFEEDKYWFCTDGGLTYYDRSNGDTTNYGSPGELAGEWVWDVDTLDDGVFVATDKGISVMDTDTGKWQRFYHPLDLPDDTVYSIDLFRYNFNKYMWAGTNDGAVCYNVNRDEWKSLDESSGLPDTRIRDVFFDGEKVWVATGAGIALFSPDGELIDIYDREDGLVHNMVESFSKYDDVMYIATSGGFSIFREDSITNTLLPRFVRTPGAHRDISVAGYEANIVESTIAGYRLKINITIKSDISDPFYLSVSTNHPGDNYGLVRHPYETKDLKFGQGEEWVSVPVEMAKGVDEITLRLSLNTSLIAPENESSYVSIDEDPIHSIPLYFMADPDGRWIEESESNNLLMTSLDISGTDVPPDPTNGVDGKENSLVIWAGIGILILVVISICFVFRRKRRGGDDGGEEGEEAVEDESTAA